MSHVDCKKWQCRMSLSLKIPVSPVEFKNGHVPCDYLFRPHVAVKKVHVALSNSRNSHVTLSVLGVKGPRRRHGWVVVGGGWRVCQVGVCGVGFSLIPKFSSFN